MSKLPLIDGLKSYTEENNILYCTPGHKGGRGFLATKEGKWMYQHFIQCDITEVDGMDNLHKPEGIIAEATGKLQNFYGSKKSYFLVNGSTSGNLAMIFSAFQEGDKVIVERNCHKSIMNGIILKKLVPVYIKNKISNKYDAPLSVDMEHFFYLLEKNKDAKGVIITYPNYYGVCVDLQQVVSLAHEYGMKVLVDSAHGAHFGINDKLPKSAVYLGADAVVMSAHKTLPSLTQTSYLHIGQGLDLKLVDLYVSMFSSTSPSYLFLASMDYARFYLEEHGTRAYDELMDLIKNYKKRINALDNFSVLSKEDVDEEIYDMDSTRLVIHLKNGHSGHRLLKYLRQNKIQAELSDERNVVLILSPFYGESEFEAVYAALKAYTVEGTISTIKVIDFEEEPAIKLLPWQVVGQKKKWVNLEEANGKICGEAIIPYPPGVPLLIPGELVSSSMINKIQSYIKNKVALIGINEDKISIVDA